MLCAVSINSTLQRHRPRGVNSDGEGSNGTNKLLIIADMVRTQSAMPSTKLAVYLLHLQTCPTAIDRTVVFVRVWWWWWWWGRLGGGGVGIAPVAAVASSRAV